MGRAVLAPYRDDPDVGDDPFAHYLDDMMHEQRESSPDPGIVAASGLIDPNYYLISGADVHEAQLDPAEHFCRYGWREGRKPNFYFDPRWYLQTNPPVEQLKINPLVRYILEGETAGRRPVPYFDPLCLPARPISYRLVKGRWRTSWRIGAARRSVRRRCSTSAGMLSSIRGN